MEGAVRKVSNFDTAYPHRDAPFVLNIHSRWDAPGDGAACMAWARSLFDATRQSSTGGVYVNFLNEEGEDRVRAAYPRGTFERLAQLKQRYDPDNFFRLNQNIPTFRTNARRRHIWRTGVSVARKSAGTYEGG